MSELTNTLPVNQEITLLSPDTLVELYILDATEQGAEDLFHFHPGTTIRERPVVFKGDTYIPFPVEVTGFEAKGKGTPPRPKLRLGNVSGFVKDLNNLYDDLLGAKFIRKRVFFKHLDDNFVPKYGGQIQPEMSEDVFFIDMPLDENKLFVEYEMGSLPDVEGVLLPRRQVLGDICNFSYRGTCPFREPIFVSDKYGKDLSFGGLKYRGRWNSFRLYNPSETAYSDGTLYSCVTQNQDSQPPSAYWKAVQVHKGNWDKEASYNRGDTVLIHSKGIDYLFIAIEPVPVGVKPPNTQFWSVDTCTKRLQTGCVVRFDPFLVKQPLPYGGFIGTVKIPTSL
jgi:lambda family phage minor tail protein L